MFRRPDTVFDLAHTRNFYEGKEVWRMSLRTG
jgi:hypothetical protein